MIRRLAGLAIAVIAIVAARAAAEAVPSDQIRLGISIRATQDDNLLQYSDGQIAIFDAGTHPERYSVRSIDDVVYEPAVSLAYDRTGAARNRTLRLRWSGDFHATNATADHASVSALWREGFGRNSLSLSGFRMPRFYLRQLFDEDVPSGSGVSRYRRASFGLTIGSVEWRRRVSRDWTGRLAYQYERRDYGVDFRERDSDTHEAGVGAAWDRPRSQLGFDASAGWRTSLAAGTDGDEAPGSPGDDPDPSYRGLVAAGRVKVPLVERKGGRVSGEVGYELRTRHYTTDRVADASHYRRDDRIGVLALALRWNPRGPFSARAFYQHENDHASFSSPSPPSTDPASYTENQFGGSVEWTGTLWKR